jgi:transposase-like protein
MLINRLKNIRKVCIECGTVFFVDASHAYARLCSKKCQNRNYRLQEKLQKEEVNMNEAAVVPKVAVGGEAMRMAHNNHNNNAHRLRSREERDERQRRIMDLKGQGYSYSEIAALVGCHVGTVGYWVLKAEGRLSPSTAAKAAKGIKQLTKKPMVVGDFQREDVLEGMADALWSRLSVGDKVRIIQHVQKEEA